MIVLYVKNFSISDMDNIGRDKQVLKINIFFLHVYRQARNAGCASAYTPDGNTHKVTFYICDILKSLQGKIYLTF